MRDGWPRGEALLLRRPAASTRSPISDRLVVPSLASLMKEASPYPPRPVFRYSFMGRSRGGSTHSTGGQATDPPRTASKPYQTQRCTERSPKPGIRTTLSDEPTAADDTLLAGRIPSSALQPRHVVSSAYLIQTARRTQRAPQRAPGKQVGQSSSTPGDRLQSVERSHHNGGRTENAWAVFVLCAR